MRHALLIKANLVFDDSLLAALMKDYDDDNTGQIDYRKFCENVMGSRPDDAGGWGSSYTGSSARIPVSLPANPPRRTRRAPQLLLPFAPVLREAHEPPTEPQVRCRV